MLILLSLVFGIPTLAAVIVLIFFREETEEPFDDDTP